MRTRLLAGIFARAIFLFGTAAGILGQNIQGVLAPAVNANFDARVAALEKQIGDQEKQLQSLKDEIELLKTANSAPDKPAAGLSQAAISSRPTLSGEEAPVLALTTPRSTPQVSATRSSLDAALASTHFIGLMDVYYSYNVHQPVSGVSTLRLFDSQTNQFALNLLELGVVRAPDSDNRIGYDFTLGFGDAVNFVNQRDPGGLGFAQYLKDAYVSYLAPVGSGLQIDVGKFSPNVGAEVMESSGNWNYSRGLLYDNGLPFYLFGARSRYSFSPKYQVTGYLVNGWDNVVDTYSSGKTVGLGFRWAPARTFSVTESVLGGRGATPQDIGWRKLTSTVVQYSPRGNVSLMANAIYGLSDNYAGFQKPVQWSGLAGYVQYRLTPLYSFATRYEYYSDPDGVTTCGPCSAPTPQHLHESTVTMERRFPSHLIARFETRYDRSDQPVFFRANTPIHTQLTATASLMFTFGSEVSPVQGGNDGK